MNRQEILAAVDHTLLSPDATWGEIRTLCDDAVRYGTASVCIPPSFVKQAKAYVGDKMKVGTVVGFPNGYAVSEAKACEARIALAEGADELDMVINIGWVKEARYDRVGEEIRRLKDVCGDHILKVIVETCLLTEDEKIRLCRVVTESGSDFIKTSTGFAGGGATPEDIELFAAHVGRNVRIKAAGGIRSFEDAEHFLELGASRLGTSRLVKQMKIEEGLR